MGSQKGSIPEVPTFSLQCPKSGKALPGSRPLRAPWLAHQGGVAWFLSRGPTNAKPRHHTGAGKLGSSGPHVPLWLDISAEASASPVGCRGSGPHARLTVLLEGWLRAGASRTRLGMGNGEQAAGHALLGQLRPGPALRPLGGLGGPGPWARLQHRDGSWFPFLSCPRPCAAPTRRPVQTQLILPGLRINICMEAEIAPTPGSLVGSCSGRGSGSAAPGPSPATAPVACVSSVSLAARILPAFEAVRRGAKCSEKERR